MLVILFNTIWKQQRKEIKKDYRKNMKNYFKTILHYLVKAIKFIKQMNLKRSFY